MTTAARVIELALRDAGVLGEDETASAAMTTDAFDTFLQMLALWQAENMFVYAQVSSSFAPTGAASYTVGSGGTVAITRPDKIDYAFWRDGTLDLPIDIMSSYEEYQSILDKSLETNPSVMFYLPSYPLGTLYLHPKPSTGTVHLVRQERLPVLTSRTETITLPPQYIMPIRYSLAEIYAPLFGGSLKQGISVLAERARKILKRQNVRITQLGMPAAVMQNYRSNILTG